MKAVFAQAAGIIAPIVKENTRRRGKAEDPFRALTFMSITDDEIPWAKIK